MASMKRPKTTTINDDDDDDDDSGSWSSLIHDILVLVISRLGAIDFVSFSCVCKSWRTVALSNRKMFMLSREPMVICLSTRLDKKKKCSLEDLKGRRFTTILPRSNDTTFLGLVSGYVILLGCKTHYFRLVNPITRHKLLFPRYQFSRVPDRAQNLKCALFYSSKIWVFVVSVRSSREVSFSFSSEPANWRANSRATWTHLYSDFPIYDLHFFQGKIYALSKDLRLYEVRLSSPTPTLLTPAKMKNRNGIKVPVEYPEFTTFGEKVFIRFHCSKQTYGNIGVNFDQMRWVTSRVVAWNEYAHFSKILKSGFTKVEHWSGSCADKYDTKRTHFTKYMWYFPHKCLDVNLPYKS